MNGKRSTNEYRGFKSTTFVLVVLGFVTGTGLLIWDYITAEIWQASVLGLITAYVARAAIGSAAEAYVATKAAPTAPPTGG